MLAVVGVGPASLHLMTSATREAVATADVLVSGKRHLQQFPDLTGEQFTPGANIPELLSWISAHQEEHIVVLASSDPLFYGIGTRVVAYFGIENVRTIPGTSAVQCLCTQSGIDTNDMWLTSSHSRSTCSDELARHNKVAVVTDALYDPREIAQQFTARGKGHRWMVIGGGLAMGNEQIHFLPVCEINADYDMNAVMTLGER